MKYVPGAEAHPWSVPLIPKGASLEAAARGEYNDHYRKVGMNPEEAYPGDDVVDIIGMDFCWQLKWDPHDPEEAWPNALSRRYRLAWHQAFAKAHGKPMAYSERGSSA